MIDKEKESLRPTDAMRKAGYEAEKQMAFFLRRAFAETPDVFVFNDITFERNGERAQIDHLVLHRFGFAIVESKSVTGTIEVNEHQEFVRTWGDQRKGMRSPIEQARLQAQLLQALLNDAKNSLRPKKMLGMVQPEFADPRFRIYIAISDQGVIKRNGSNPPELMKAERVVSEIFETTRQIQQTQGVSGFVKFMTAAKDEEKKFEDQHVGAFSDQELVSIRSYLLAQALKSSVAQCNSTPPKPMVASEIPAAEQRLTSKPIKCNSCDSSNVEILYGRYGYYIHCGKCDTNQTLPKKCEICGSKAKLRKDGNSFYRDCEPCGTKRLVHTNVVTD